MIAKDQAPKKDQAPIPAGMHIARCYGLFDTGTHHDERFDKDRREIVIVWEVCKQRIKVKRDDAELDLPRAISKRYTLSLHEKSQLRKDLQSWRGRPFTPAELAGFEVKNILGKPCLLNITHTERDGKTYANIGAITPLMEGMEAPKQENESAYFSFDDYTSREHGFPDGMPLWIQEKAKESREWQELGNPSPESNVSSEPEAEDLPF